jgi:hypothetical protein
LIESFDIPDSWLHLTLGEIIDYGKAMKVEPRDIPSDSWVLELEDIEIKYIIDVEGNQLPLYYAEMKVKNGKYHVVPRTKPSL